MQNETQNELNDWDKSLLKKHLGRYKKLESGEKRPSSAREVHFVEVFRNNAEPTTQHEIAYYKYKKIYQIKQQNSIMKPIQELPDSVEEALNILDENILLNGTSKDGSQLSNNFKNWFFRTKLPLPKIESVALVWLNFIVSESSLSKGLEQFSAEKLNTLSNEYTKALDGGFAEGLKSGADYISPTLHRLIIEGHTLPVALHKVKDALPDDSSFEEIKNLLTSLASDMSSVVGLPMAVLGKENVESLTQALNKIGISDQKFADLMSFNTVELIGSAVPVLALMFSWNENDTQKFSRIVGALAISSVYAGNPVSAIIVLVGLAKSFQKSKEQGVGKQSWVKSLSEGSLLSALVIASMSLLGPVVWTTMIALIVMYQIQNKIRIIVDFEGIINWVKEQILSLGKPKKTV